MASSASFSRISPVVGSILEIFSTSSPKNSIRKIVSSYTGKISNVSPLTLKEPLLTTKSFLVYCCLTKSNNNLSKSYSWPNWIGISLFLYSSGDPSP